MCGIDGAARSQCCHQAAFAFEPTRNGAAGEGDQCEDDGGSETAPGEHDGEECAVGWISQRRRDAP